MLLVPIVEVVGTEVALGFSQDRTMQEASAVGEKWIVGIIPWSNPNYEMMKAAGIEWLRLSFDYPFKDKIGGESTDKFREHL
jgi:hypothetical protein